MAKQRLTAGSTRIAPEFMAWLRNARTPARYILRTLQMLHDMPVCLSTSKAGQLQEVLRSGGVE